MALSERYPKAKMHTLVIATDGSKFSEGAVRESIQWSKQYGSTLYAVCTAQVGLGQLQFAAEVVSEIDKAARAACESIRLRAQAEGVQCEIVVHEGEEPYEHIVGEAEKLHADAIIMGRRGRRGLMKLLMGSVTHLVLGHAPCNVFVVPRAGKLLAKRILVATDGSSNSDRAASQSICLAKKTQGLIVACSVVHGGMDLKVAKDNVAKVTAIAADEQIDVETVVCVGNAYGEIIDSAIKNDVDLIVVGTHGRTGVKKLLVGSVAERVIGMSDRTVMVVR